MQNMPGRRLSGFFINSMGFVGTSRHRPRFFLCVYVPACVKHNLHQTHTCMYKYAYTLKDY